MGSTVPAGTYNVDTLQFQIQRIIPMVYDDSLSMYELVNAVVAKLNEVINDTNAYFATDLQTYVTDQLNTWKSDGTMATLINQDVSNDLAQRAINALYPPAPLTALLTGTDDAVQLNAILQWAQTHGNTAVILPEGTYRGRTTVTLFTYQKLIPVGNVTWDMTGYAIIGFRVKNDDTLASQGYDASWNGYVIDNTQGMMYIKGDLTAGSIGVQIGDDASYVGSTHFAAFSGLRGVMMSNLDIGIKRTNNNAFAIRLTDVRVSGCNTAYQLPADTMTNSGELDTFTNVFINNNTLGLDLQNWSELSFVGCSIDFNHTPIKISNTTGFSVLHFTNCHIERFDSLIIDATNSYSAYVDLNNVQIIPSEWNTAGNIPRKLFTGANLTLNLNAVTLFTDTSNEAAADLHASTAGRTRGTVLQGGSIPIATSADQNILPNYDFSGGLANGWTASVPANTTVDTTSYYTGTQSIKMNGSGYMALQITVPVHKREYVTDLLYNGTNSTAGSLNLVLTAKDSAGNTLLTTGAYNQVFVKDGAYHKFKFPQRNVFPAGTTQVEISISTSADFAGSCNIDSVYME